ncbi:MAG: hypothetical protein JXJ22_12915, partial [Bacteroidales bacterium]|nr:hypothetical protein [Bacteroidales bacterium]
MNIKIITVLFLLTCFTACKKQNKIFISFSGESEMPEITIQNKNLKVPFKFSCNPKTGSGPVYFITPDGKTYVSGKPLKIIETEGKTSYTWNINQREIVISILNDSGKYRFSFYATPNIDILKWGMSIPATENEYFTGLFERVVDGNQEKSWEEGIKEALNLRGQEVDMIIKPTLSLYCPFYLSSNNYGLFINGTWPGHYDFCKTESNIVLIEFEGISLSGIIYTADYPAEIIKAHSLHIGPTIVPPKWAFLPWRWRDNHSNQPIYYDGTSVNAPYNSMVVEDILMMEALDIPNGAYWIDRPWARGFKGYEDFEWDNERFPGATNMIKWLHSKDIRIMLWLAPWVTGNMRQEAIEKGYSMPIKGPSYDLDSSNVALIDFTNPYACKWWQENGIEKMLKQGINGFKLDRAEELVPETNEIVLFDERTAREARNDYPVMYVRTVNESCKKNCGDDFVLFPRAGYSGSSKYSGFWGGDIGSPPEGLRAAIIAAQRSAIIGFPIWGSDIGGYW